MSILALWFSIVVATIPNEWQETALASLNPPLQQVDVYSDGEKKIKLIMARDLLFAGEVDDTTRRRKSLFSNTLVLPGFNLYEALKIDDPKKLAWKEHLFDLRGRHLEQAVLGGADLTKADLTGAQLQGTGSNRARLQGASLDLAQLQGASLHGAAINATNFSFALLWRTNWGEKDPAGLGVIRLNDATWGPVQRGGSDSVPWDSTAYAKLRSSP